MSFCYVTWLLTIALVSNISICRQNEDETSVFLLVEVFLNSMATRHVELILEMVLSGALWYTSQDVYFLFFAAATLAVSSMSHFKSSHTPRYLAWSSRVELCWQDLAWRRLQKTASSPSPDGSCVKVSASDNFLNRHFSCSPVKLYIISLHCISISCRIK